MHADLLPGHLFESVVSAFKALFAMTSTPATTKMSILLMLVNLGTRLPSFLVFILGNDLIQVRFVPLPSPHPIYLSSASPVHRIVACLLMCR